ncbi:MAG: hypothetical protein KDB22_12535 [Planctomycetales bacterium]|nr:hypothetical protein [Planctomycetales bacterium]
MSCKFSFSWALLTLFFTSAVAEATMPVPLPAPLPSVETNNRPRARMLVFLELEDGSVIQADGAILRNGASGKLVAHNSTTQSQFQAAVEPSNSDNTYPVVPAVAPQAGKWMQVAVYCRHGRLLGYKRQWVPQCSSCGGFHQ